MSTNDTIKRQAALRDIQNATNYAAEINNRARDYYQSIGVTRGSEDPRTPNSGMPESVDEQEEQKQKTLLWGLIDDNQYSGWYDSLSNVNVLRQLAQTKADNNVTEVQGQITDNQRNRDFLDLMEKRNSILDEIEKLNQLDSEHDVIFDPKQAKIVNKTEQLQDLYKQLSYIDETLKDNKHNDFVYDTMFDQNKLSEKDEKYILMYKASGNAWENSINRKDKEKFSKLETIANYAKDAGIGAWSLLWNTVAAPFRYALGGKGTTRQYIQEVDRSNNGIHGDFADVVNKTYKTNEKIDQSTIDDMRAKLDRKEQELTAKLNVVNEDAKRGKTQIGGVHVGFLDREKVDEEWLKHHNESMQENVWYQLLFNPGDAVAETGSSVAMMSSQIMALGADGVINYAGQHAIDYLTNPGSKARYLSNLAKFATSVGSHVAFTERARRMETSSEAAGAINERILEQSAALGLNLQDILPEIKQKLQSRGVDTTGFTENDYIQNAAIYRLNTSNELFNSLIYGSQEGLEKLVNANNALAIGDLVEAMPFFNYGGKIMSSAAKVARQGVVGAGKKILTKNAVSKLSGIGETAVNQGLLDASIEALGRTWMSKYPKILFRGGNIANWAISKAAKGALVGVSEGIEEGQQYLLSERFKHGEYDKYKRPVSMLDVREIFGNADLAGEAIAAYSGISSLKNESNDELVKAMNIGFTSSFMFGEAMNIASNLGGAKDGNFRGLIRDFKLDGLTYDLVADNFDNRNTTNHANILYKMLKDNNADVGEINHRLQLIKNANFLQDVGGDNKWIDDTIALANAVNIAINNPNLLNKDVLKENGIKTGSRDYQRLIVECAKAIYNLSKIGDVKKSNGEQIQTQLDAVQDQAAKFFDDSISDEEYQQMENTKLGKIVKAVIEKYNSMDQEDKQKILQYKDKLKSSFRNWNSEDEQARNEARSTMTEEQYSHYVSASTNGMSDDVIADDIVTAELDRQKKQYISENLSEKNYDVLRYVRSQVWDSSKSRKENEKAVQEYYKERIKDKKKFLNDVYEYVKTKPNLSQEFVEHYLNLFDIHRRLAYKNQVLEQFKDQLKRLSLMRSTTGLDVNTSNLQGLIDFVEQDIEKYKEFHDKHVSKEISDFFDQNDFSYDDEQQEAYENGVKALTANKAVHKSMQAIADIFAVGRATPKTIKELIFGKERDVDLDTMSVEYDSNKQRLKSGDVMNDTSDDVVKNIDKIEKKSAWKLIKKMIDDAEQAQNADAKQIIDEIEQELTSTQSQQEQSSSEYTSDSTQQKQSASQQQSPAQSELMEQFAHGNTVYKKTQKANEAIDKAKEAKQKRKETEKESGKNDQQDEFDAAFEEDGDEDAASSLMSSIKADQQNQGQTTTEENKQQPSQDDIQEKQNIKDGIAATETENVEQIPEESKDPISDALSVALGNEDFQNFLDWIVLSNTEELNSNGGKSKISEINNKYFGDQQINYRFDEDQNAIMFQPEGGSVTYIPAHKDVLEKLNSKKLKEQQLGENQEAFDAALDNDENQENFDNALNEQDQQEEFDYQIDADEKETEKDLEDVEEEEAIREQNQKSKAEDIEYTQIDLFEFNENGVLTYNGQVVQDEDIAQLAKQELLLLNRAEIVGFKYEDLPDGTIRKTEEMRSTANATEQSIGNFLENTFFYDPKAEELPTLTAGYTGSIKDGTAQPIMIQTEHPLASGKQLSEKLSTPGWLQNVLQNGKAYYIVGASQDVAKMLIRPEKENDVRNSLTVGMILDDGENCYFVALRSLDKIPYKDPITKKTKHSNGHLRWRNFLRRQNLDRFKVMQDLPGIDLDSDNIDITKILNELIADKKKQFAKNQFDGHNIEGTLGVSFEKWYSGVRLSKQANDLRTNILKSAENVAMRYYAKPGKANQFMSSGDIDGQLKSLCQFRNKIIEKYMIVGTAKNGETTYRFDDRFYKDGVYIPRQDVQPDDVMQSNGRFNSVREVVNGIKTPNPVFRSIAEDNQSVDDIYDDLMSGKLTIGYGRGVTVKNQPFAISNILSNVGEIMDDVKPCGLSGKIYWIMKNPYDQTKPSIPVMLSEEKFDSQKSKDGNTINWISSENDVKLCLGGEIDESGNANSDTYEPSAAEVLLYMMFGKIYTGTNDFGVRQRIVEFFIHHGEETLFSNHPSYGEYGFTTFAMKQLHIERTSGGIVINIAMPEKIGDATAYRCNQYNEKDIFGDSPEQIELRRKIVYALSTQFHWNTDVSYMQEDMKASSLTANPMSEFIRSVVNSQAKSFQDCGYDIDTYLNQSVSIGGCSQLSFKLSDFYEKDGDRIIAKNVHTLAWMIKNQKLKTDLDKERPFLDPFVFAYRIKEDTPVKETVKEKAEPVNKKHPDIIQSGIHNFLYTQSSEQHVEEIADALNIHQEYLGISKTEEQRKEYLAKQNKLSIYANKDLELLDQIIAYSTDENKTNDQIIQELFAQYNNGKKEEDRVDAKDIHLYDPKNDTQEGVSIFPDVEEGGVLKVKIIRSKTTGKVFSRVSAINEVFESEDDEISTQFTGQYSQVKGEGRVDINKARQELYKMLGIDAHNVVLENAVMRGAENQIIYGCTTIASDIISKAATGIIILSNQAGSGIHYHEAWHYVNLLMHDPKERIKIYEAYKSTHKKLKNAKYSEVEEYMAEDFRKWMQTFNDKSLTGKIKKFFRNVLDWLLITRTDGGKYYRSVYEAIKNGEYNQKKTDRSISQQEINEFLKAHPDGVFRISHDVVGYTKDQIKSLDKVQTYQQLEDALDAITQQIIVDMKLSNNDEVFHMKRNFDKYLKSAIEKLYDYVSNQNDSEQESRILMLDQLSEENDSGEIINKSMIEAYLVRKLEDMGFKVKTEKIKDTRNADANDEENMEDKPDNYWDKLDITSSKKENAAAATKLFLSSVQKYKYSTVPIRDKETRQIIGYETKMVPVRSPFGVPQTWDFSEAWNKILNELWMSESYGEKDKDGNYKSSSLRGRVKQLADSDPFFKALDIKLNTLEGNKRKPDDSQMKSQIFSTVNCYKNPVSFIQISDARSYESYSEDDQDPEEDTIQEQRGYKENIDETTRQWRFNDDGALKVSWSLPRRWSQNLAGNGLIYYDRKTKKAVVSKARVDDLYARLLALQKIVSEVENTSKDKGYMKDLKKEGITEEQWMNNQLFGTNKNKKASLVEQFLQLCNMMSLPIDIQTMNVYANKYIKSDKSLNQRIFIAIKNLVLEKNKATGGLCDIITQLHSDKNIGKESITLVVNGKEKTMSLDGIYRAFSNIYEPGKLAVAYNSVHPQLSEYSVKSPNGETVYPMNMNNYTTDVVRGINDKDSGKLKDLQKSPYCKHSLICDAAEQIQRLPVLDEDSMFRLKAFIGMKDEERQEGNDYHGITPMEDFLSKMFMTQHDELIFPTMADKKKWYSLRSSKLKLVHDVVLDTNVASSLIIARSVVFDTTEQGQAIADKKYTIISGRQSYTTEYVNARNAWFKDISGNKNSEQNAAYLQQIQDYAKQISNERQISIQPNRFSDSTLNIFAGYFIDELNTIIDYYDPVHIQMCSYDTTRIQNYHGNPKVLNGVQTMDFSGNCGKFRYFYDIDLSAIVKNIGLFNDKQCKEMRGFNLNQILNALYQLEEKIKTKGVLNESEKTKDTQKSFTVAAIAKEPIDDIGDGFTLIRRFLRDLKNSVGGFVEGQQYNQDLLTAINNKLIKKTEEQLQKLSQQGSSLQIFRSEYSSTLGKKIYLPDRLPSQFAEETISKFINSGLSSEYGNIYDIARNNKNIASQIIYSMIANFVVNSAISTIEVEKVFSGDPAFYKWKTNKFNPKDKVYISLQDEDQSCKVEVEVENLGDMYSDKIKRLGGLISPGSELRTDWSEAELYKDPTLYAEHYTNLNVMDVKCKSMFLDHITDTFKTQLVVDDIRTNRKQQFLDYIDKHMSDYNGQGKPDFETAIGHLYKDKKLLNHFISTLPTHVQNKIQKDLELQTESYGGINVCDAQVFIRPALYRKIRMALGEWSVRPDKNGYSDEEAYNIIENNANWMYDKELAAKVKQFQINALKMSYFGHQFKQIAETLGFNLPIYNKMAIFPMFKFHASDGVGRKIYDRMNLVGHEIDMISFMSAVKVGGVQRATQINNKNASAENALTSLTDMLDIVDGKPKYQNSLSIDYTTDNVVDRSGMSNVLPITRQSLKDIRMQLNTHAHEAEARAIGTQMFKIAFSNIIDDAFYGDRPGWMIRNEIMDCINKLTLMGVEKLHDQFFVEDQDGQFSVSDKKMADFVSQVIKSNGLGFTAENIINNGGVAAGLMSRTVFENSVAKRVNEEVININTKGGTAIQQSVFGFQDILGSNVSTQGEEGEIITDEKGKTTVAHSYPGHNGGKELIWDMENGTMEIMLSMNFFKPVVPKQFQKFGHDVMRQWLINHDVIKGIKKNIVLEDQQKNNDTGELETVQVQDVVENEGSMSTPKPFGIGYRIPTQGQSSMFAYTVADVLPSNVGDLIVVPREFTAQTGSDFDVDKIYLANISYQNGNEVDDDSENGITNKLLRNYMQLITDVKNYANARASIDTITSNINDNLLNKYLKSKNTGYCSGMEELMPVFQVMRKMEFGVGKTGIGPFALNVTNLSLTQYTKLTFDYGENEYGFKALHEITGHDGIRVADWLSAMVNAHVDVAKDAYVFDLNVNQATYNHTNFLLRAGMGMSTFHFLAQPILKDYANALNVSGGLYQGRRNSDGSSKKWYIDKDIYKIYVEKLQGARNLMTDEQNKKDGEWVDNAILFFKSKYDDTTKDLIKENKLNITSPFKKGDMFIPVVENYKGGNSRAIQIDGKEKLSIGEYAIKYSNDVNNYKSLIYQLCALDAFKDLETYANGISTLIQCSQIDTKKFGNTIVTQRNWKNKYDQFRFGVTQSCDFIIDDEKFKNELPLKKSDDDKNGFSSKQRTVAALDIYFNKTFLNLKLNNAVNITRRILSTQLITATDKYMDVFERVCTTLSGEVEYSTQTDPRIQETNADKVKSYKLINNQDVVQEIGNKLDNILRYNALKQFGQQVYEDDGMMIDFTMGGNQNAVQEKMASLLGLNDDDKSIFERINDLVTAIKINPNALMENGRRAYANLYRHGEIINDLLRDIQPMTPTKEFPIGRLLMLEPSQFTPDQIKRRYQNAFYQLLQSKNPEVRELARDIAFYAYYSTYDQNVQNSFFDLVPPEYRAQYDKSLYEYLNSSENQNVDEDQIIDIISRNFWYDKQLVPIYNPEVNDRQFSDVNQALDEEDDRDPILNPSYESVLGAIYHKDSTRSFPTVVLSTSVRNKPKTSTSNYLQIPVNGITYLYKYVGEIERTRKNGETTKDMSPVAIYTVVPKGGLHYGKQNQYEFFLDDEHDSIFDENMLPIQAAEDITREDILKRCKDSGANVYVVQEGMSNRLENQIVQNTNSNITFTIKYFKTNVPENRKQTNVNVYTQSGINYSSDPKFSGYVAFQDSSTTPRKDARNDASVIINFRLNKSDLEQDDEKIIDVVFGADVNAVAQQIADRLDDNDGTLLFDSSLKDWKYGRVENEQMQNSMQARTDQYIQDYISTQERNLIQQGENEDSVKEKLNGIRKECKEGGKLYNRFRSTAIRFEMSAYLNSLVQAIYSARGNKQISKVSSIADSKQFYLALAMNNVTITSKDCITSRDNPIYMENTNSSASENHFRSSRQFGAFKSILMDDIANLLDEESRNAIIAERRERAEKKRIDDKIKWQQDLVNKLGKAALQATGELLEGVVVPWQNDSKSEESSTNNELLEQAKKNVEDDKKVSDECGTVANKTKSVEQSEQEPIKFGNIGSFDDEEV